MWMKGKMDIIGVHAPHPRTANQKRGTVEGEKNIFRDCPRVEEKKSTKRWPKSTRRGGPRMM